MGAPPVTPDAPAAFDDDDRGRRFRALFQSEFAYLWTSLRRLGVPARDLEDVTHDVFIEVYAKLARYDPSRPPRPWLFAFAFRFASDYRRLARHRVEVMGDREEALSLGAPADEAVATREARVLIARALDRLDLERRALFILCELDEQPMKDVAEALGIPLQTAYSRLRVAREEFAAALRRLKGGLR